MKAKKNKVPLWEFAKNCFEDLMKRHYQSFMFWMKHDACFRGFGAQDESFSCVSQEEISPETGQVLYILDFSKLSDALNDSHCFNLNFLSSNPYFASK